MAALALGGCDRVAGVPSKGQKEPPLPIKLETCDLDYKNCKVIARFADRRMCESAVKRASWSCNDGSEPGITVPPQPPGPGYILCSNQPTGVSVWVCNE